MALSADMMRGLDVTSRWRALTERQVAGLVDMYESGRWRRYYGEEQFRLLMEAYETLMDPIRRRAYDQSLRPAPPAAPIPVEPLTAPIEPLAGWRQHAASGPLWSTRHLDEWFDELWTALEADLFYFRLPRR